MTKRAVLALTVSLAAGCAGASSSIVDGEVVAAYRQFAAARATLRSNVNASRYSVGRFLGVIDDGIPAINWYEPNDLSLMNVRTLWCGKGLALLLVEIKCKSTAIDREAQDLFYLATLRWSRDGGWQVAGEEPASASTLIAINAVAPTPSALPEGEYRQQYESYVREMQWGMPIQNPTDATEVVLCPDDTPQIVAKGDSEFATEWINGVTEFDVEGTVGAAVVVVARGFGCWRAVRPSIGPIPGYRGYQSIVLFGVDDSSCPLDEVWVSK